MGGNALLYVRTERKNKQQYDRILKTVMGTLCELFPATRLGVTRAVADKETFGDVDILLENRNLPIDWIYQVQQAFTPDELMINRLKQGNTGSGAPRHFIRKEANLEPGHPWMHDGTHYTVPREAIACSAVSFEFDNFQIDLVVTQPEDFEIAQVYYAYNDLGNLMGRIADRMGYKYGWNGLWRHVGDGCEIYDTVLVSRNPAAIFSFLGYDYDRWQLGFESLTNMFEFAASSPWFHRAPYQFENRNHKDRIRDQKRTSYQAFVAWIEDKPWLDRYTWVSYERNEDSPGRQREKQTHLKRGLAEFRSFNHAYTQSVDLRQFEIDAKAKWNGPLITQMTGYTNKELGDFMRYCRGQKQVLIFCRTFEEWICNHTPEQIRAFVMLNLQIYSDQKRVAPQG